MGEFIKTCDQYLHWFNFSKFFDSIILLHHLPPPPPPPTHTPLFLLTKNKSSENALLGEWVIFFYLGSNDKNWGRVLLSSICKNVSIFLIHIFASNLNTRNLKLFHNHGGICRFRKTLKKDSGEINPLGIHKNI